jgi:hypothetical protein
LEDSLSGKFISVEDGLSGRQPKWKTISVEDDLIGRLPQWKTTSLEDDLSEKGPQWKMTLLAWNQQNKCRSTLAVFRNNFEKMEDGLHGRQNQS